MKVTAEVGRRNGNVIEVSEMHAHVGFGIVNLNRFKGRGSGIGIGKNKLTVGRIAHMMVIPEGIPGTSWRNADKNAL